MARILLADENPLVLDLMQVLLAEAGHDLLVAGRTDVMLSLACGTSGTPHPDLIVLSADLEPGFLAETIAEVRAESGRPDLPVVVTLPPGDTQIAKEIRWVMGVTLLPKPFDRAVFLETVLGALNRSRDAGSTESDDHISPAPAATILEAAGYRDTVQAEAAALLRAWLADEGRAIMAHDVHEYVQSSGPRILKEVAWKVVPELAEGLIRDEIRRITEEIEN